MKRHRIKYRLNDFVFHRAIGEMSQREFCSLEPKTWEATMSRLSTGKLLCTKVLADRITDKVNSILNAEYKRGDLFILVR